MPKRVTPHPDDVRPTFIRAWRKKRGLSLQELAKRVDGTPPTLSRIETNRGTITWQALHSIGQALEVDPYDLLFCDPADPELQSVLTQIRRSPRDEQEKIIRVVKAMLPPAG